MLRAHPLVPRPLVEELGVHSTRQDAEGIGMDGQRTHDTGRGQRAATGIRHEEPATPDDILPAPKDHTSAAPEEGGSLSGAEELSLDCGVCSECFEHALTHDERFGIWGGSSERERHRLKRAG